MFSFQVYRNYANTSYSYEVSVLEALRKLFDHVVKFVEGSSDINQSNKHVHIRACIESRSIYMVDVAFLLIHERNDCQPQANVNERCCISYDHIIVQATWLWGKCHCVLPNAVVCVFLVACLQSPHKVVFNVYAWLPFNKGILTKWTYIRVCKQRNSKRKSLYQLGAKLWIQGAYIGI